MGITTVTLNDYIKTIGRKHWHIVKVSTSQNYYEMARWREENNFGEFIFLGTTEDTVTYLFEREQDAVMFALRWG